ncbi:hypothetical protein Tco_1157625, partial [Tanacetum coccineum]
DDLESVQKFWSTVGFAIVSRKAFRVLDIHGRTKSNRGGLIEDQQLLGKRQLSIQRLQLTSFITKGLSGLSPNRRLTLWTSVHAVIAGIMCSSKTVLASDAVSIRYHPGKASVAADALSRNERAKPLMAENVKDENLYGMDKELRLVLIELPALGAGAGYHALKT